MSGGGKGGSQTAAVEIPQWVEDSAKRNLARAERVQQMEFQPYTGLDVAAFTPSQQAAQNMTIGAAEAFGLAQPGQLSAGSGMPKAQTIGGVSGYSASPLYQQAVRAARQADPKTEQVRRSLYNQPNVGMQVIGAATPQGREQLAAQRAAATDQQAAEQAAMQSTLRAAGIPAQQQTAAQRQSGIDAILGVQDQGLGG